MSVLKNALGANSYWQVNKHLAKMLQSLNATVLLSELIDLDYYYEIKEQRLSRDGKMYFFATADSLEEKTSLSYKEQKTALDILQAFQLIETKIMGIPAKLYFTLSEDHILHLLKANIEQREMLDLRFDTNSNTKNLRLKRKYEKVSKDVVTDTPPIATNLSSTEIPNNCEKEKTEKPINLSLKEKSRNEKVNSGGGGENSQANVSNPNKPKKQPVQRLNLATLTDTQKAEINAVLLKYDSVNDAKAAWIKWLEHKSKAGGKIKQYLNHETALTALELASKQAQYQSEALTDAINEAIANEYLGLHLSKHVKKTYQNGTTNGKIDRATANNAYMERIRRGEDLPYK
jgi:hypothetical protein